MANSVNSVQEREATEGVRTTAESREEATESHMKLASTYINLTVTIDAYRRQPYFI
ncbi:MAG TPA: hypothetical protein VI389_03320 [Geobacteraceae bacterium]